jgi:hypothetical protein
VVSEFRELNANLSSFIHTKNNPGDIKGSQGYELTRPRQLRGAHVGCDHGSGCWHVTDSLKRMLSYDLYYSGESSNNRHMTGISYYSSQDAIEMLFCAALESSLDATSSAALKPPLAAAADMRSCARERSCDNAATSVADTLNSAIKNNCISLRSWKQKLKKQSFGFSTTAGAPQRPELRVLWRYNCSK